jgi:hypothetical protein
MGSEMELVTRGPAEIPSPLDQSRVEKSVQKGTPLQASPDFSLTIHGTRRILCRGGACPALCAPLCLPVWDERHVASKNH